NVKFGLKDLNNRDAQDQYIQECTKMLDDLNVRYVRARFPDRTRDEADAIFARVASGETVDGLSRDDLLRLPDRRFFRRRGELAFQMVGTHGEAFTDVEQYLTHVLASLPQVEGRLGPHSGLGLSVPPLPEPGTEARALGFQSLWDDAGVD